MGGRDVLPRVRRKSEIEIRLDGIAAVVLLTVGGELGSQADSAAFVAA